MKTNQIQMAILALKTETRGESRISRILEPIET